MYHVGDELKVRHTKPVRICQVRVVSVNGMSVQIEYLDLNEVFPHSSDALAEVRKWDRPFGMFLLQSELKGLEV